MSRPLPVPPSLLLFGLRLLSKSNLGLSGCLMSLRAFDDYIIHRIASYCGCPCLFPTLLLIRRYTRKHLSPA
jgi:hypothetical protein